MNSNILDNFHVVLVEPQNSRNIGSVARAMSNLGFSYLHLVAPQNYDPQIAEVTACWGTSVLDNLQQHATFAEAIAPMQNIIGLSGRESAGKNLAHYVTLPDWAATLPPLFPHQTALCFGPEDHGLRSEHINQCQKIVRIPSQSQNPSFNLAQSVLLTLYEINAVTNSLSQDHSIPDNPVSLPTGNDFAQLDRLLTLVMQEGGFIRPGSPSSAPDTIKSLFRRLDMTEQEMGLLLGLFGRVHITLMRRETKES